MLRRWSWESLRVGVVMLCVVAVLGFACSAPQVAQDPPSPSDRPETFISLVPRSPRPWSPWAWNPHWAVWWCKETVSSVYRRWELLTPNLSVALAQPAVVLADGSAAAGIDDLERIARVEVLPWLHAASGGFGAERRRRSGSRAGSTLAAAEPRPRPRGFAGAAGSLAQGEI